MIDERQTYETAYERAKRYALRHVSADQASEVAHDVAVAMVKRFVARGRLEEERSLSALIYRSVINRLIDHHRAGNRRAAAELTHANEVDAAREWADPVAVMEADELAEVMREAIINMPPGMARVFLLVRDHDRTYKEVAAELGIGVGTVHTQLSRAYALLRDRINQYRASNGDKALSQRPSAANMKRRTQP